MNNVLNFLLTFVTIIALIQIVIIIRLSKGLKNAWMVAEYKDAEITQYVEKIGQLQRVNGKMEKRIGKLRSVLHNVVVMGDGDKNFKTWAKRLCQDILKYDDEGRL